jgi:hypothetical protein
LVHTKLQTVFNLKHPSSSDRLVHEIIMMHAVRAERLGPSGFDRCLEMLLEGFRLLGQGIPLEGVTKRLSVSTGTQAKAPVSSDIPWLLDRYLSDRVTREMIEEAIDLAGFNGNIIVEHATGCLPSVESVRGYTFELSPLIPLTAYVEEPRIFCIDGFVEDVAELHHLLEDAAEAKEPALVFIRGMSDEVLHTLKVNYDRGSLKVIPIKVPFDFEGINTLADLCSVTGADLVTSAKGDLISSIDFRAAPHVERASIFANRLVIHETSTSRAVASQANKLREKRAEAEHDSLMRLFDKRLRSLTPNHVNIRLPDDRLYVQRAQAIDYTLRAVHSLLSHGTVMLDNRKVLAATQVAGSIHAQRCLRTLSEAGAAVFIPQSDLAGQTQISAP